MRRARPEARTGPGPAAAGPDRAPGSDPIRAWRRRTDPCRSVPAPWRLRRPPPRARGWEGASCRLPQAVADPAHGLDRRAAEGPVDPLAQPAHVDLDHVRPRLVGEVPGVLDELESRKHLAGTAHERLEEGEFLGRELDVDASPRHLPAGGVE